MRRSGSDWNESRHQRGSERGDDDRHDGSGGDRHAAQNSGEGNRDHDGRHRGHDDGPDWDRAFDLELDERRHGLDLEIDVDRHGRWLDIDVDLELFDDLELEIETRVAISLLQPDQSPVAVVVGGEGNAVGDNTLVDASIFSRLIDLGAMTVAFGTADFESIAVSDDDLVFASAVTFADVAGADLVFIVTQGRSVSSSDAQSSLSREESTTHFVAIDFEEFDFLGGPIVVDYADAVQYREHGCSCRCDGHRGINIDGNVAQFDADALARAESTLVDISSSILTVENELSSVSAVVVTAVA